jgi:hypothetical protein
MVLTVLLQMGHRPQKKQPAMFHWLVLTNIALRIETWVVGPGPRPTTPGAPHA